MIRNLIVTVATAFLLPVIAHAADPQICLGKAEAWATKAQPGFNFRTTCAPTCAPGMHQSELFAGSGVSCAAATSDLSAQLEKYAKGYCLGETGFSFCSLQVFPAGSCRLEGGVYSQLGYVNFHCRDILC
ncbi:MAG TPA: hypothetical protein VGE98_01005 [Thermoanaerobaculia bacterium]